jgi:hypothetical protein
MRYNRAKTYQAEALPSIPGHAKIFDVAISFTARDPLAGQLAAELHVQLSQMGLEVFYYADIEKAAQALGERLSELLPSIYRDRARLVVLIGSLSYGKTPWTKRELDFALQRPEDDAGRKRIVIISADGTAIEALAPDTLHLGDQTAGPESIATAARLIALRCGVKPGWWRRGWPWVLPVASGLPLLEQLGFAGSEPELTVWTVLLGALSVFLACVFYMVPAFWMSRRKSAVGNKLMVVTEGNNLQRFRRYSVLTGVVFLLLTLALSTLCTWTLIDTRNLASQIRILAKEGAPDEAMRRFAGERQRLASFELELLPLFEKSILSVLPKQGWLQFPGLYAQYKQLADASLDLEQGFYQASGAVALQEGDDVLDHLQTALALRETSPIIAQRLFETSLARTLEWLMSGNDFYYGNKGARAWSIYSRLRVADGVDKWISAHGQTTLSNNSGLTPQITIYQAQRGDVSAFAKSLKFVTGREPDKGALEALASNRLPKEMAEKIGLSISATWLLLHADDRPSPDGFILAAAYAVQVPEKAEAFFIERAVGSTQEQERAHALSGLYVLLINHLAKDEKGLAELLLSKQKEGSQLEQMSANGRWVDIKSCSSAVADSLETDLRIDLSFKPEQNRTPAGIPSTDNSDTIDEKQVLKTLRAYLQACGANADPVLVTSIQTRFGSETQAKPVLELKVLRERYNAAAKKVPGAAYDPGVLELVEILREMGETGDPAAADYLDSIFERLPHGNMSITAAESLLRLRGRFGPTVLEKVRELTVMKSSIYRPETLEMLMRNADRIKDTEERLQITRDIALISISGNAKERGQMLDILGKLEPKLALRRAFFLTLSSDFDDRLEGIERLWRLWNAPIKP